MLYVFTKPSAHSPFVGFGIASETKRKEKFKNIKWSVKCSRARLHLSVLIKIPLDKAMLKLKGCKM